MQVRITALPISMELAAQLPADEAAQALELGQREDTFTFTFAEDAILRGYAVFAPDDEAGFFVIYMARSMMKGLAKTVLAMLFGAATVSGKPLRVHTTKLESMASMMGAKWSDLIRDADGLPMGVFRG